MSSPAAVWRCPAFDHERLLRDYGSPLFLFFPEVLRRNVEGLRQAVDRLYPNNVLAYSVKTNYLPYAVRTVVRFGVVPEIVSGLELDLVEKLRCLDANTIVNGPLKTEAELRRILRYRCKINVDNWTELEVLERLARENGEPIEIGLRVSAELGTVPWLRFGFRSENGEVEEVAKKIRQDMPFLRVVGLHNHGGTNITDVSYYAAASRLLCGLAKRLSGAGLMEVKYLDLGGGYATDCPFKDKSEWTVPKASEYVSAIAEPILQTFGDRGPTLILEPGRYLIDDTFILLMTVERVRGLNQDEVVVDAGINVFPSARFRRHDFLSLTSGPRPRKKYALFGPLCMQSDCLGDGVVLPELRPGDVLCVNYAGAYSISQSWNFIRLSPAVVAVENGSALLVRERQTINHLTCRDVNY